MSTECYFAFFRQVNLVKNAGVIKKYVRIGIIPFNLSSRLASYFESELEMSRYSHDDSLD